MRIAGPIKSITIDERQSIRRVGRSQIGLLGKILVASPGSRINDPNCVIPHVMGVGKIRCQKSGPPQYLLY